VYSVIRQPPEDTAVEDISNELVTLGYSVINILQITTIRPQPQGGHQFNIPLLLVTLTHNEKAKEIFKQTSLGNFVIIIEVYRNHGGLTQCYNCQKFGHVWKNCKNPPSLFVLRRRPPL
jgi:hypothetical protein